MMRRNFAGAVLFLLTAVSAVCNHICVEAADAPQRNHTTGPETEQRFPPLVLPDGFKATLFACDPLVEYPSVIALGPRPHTLFIAHDYVTGLGVDIVRRDEIRVLADTDRDGYADRSTLFAKGFNSIQGLAFHDGAVYVMHAPLLTRLHDTDGDDVADERQDLLDGLGLPPEENDNRLHCANGVVAGHDGWLYLALGDRGCDVERPEGDRLVFQQGGILRCRTDGRDLHVFSTGLRNIYDVALDDELNVFVRDNENDGGTYMIRVCHCFFGSDHGYPYHYYERPDEAMPPLADLGRGSSAGGATYLETAFPREFRESLFFCEWGRAVVRYHRPRKGSSFAQVTEVDFAAGAADDPYGFKPTDLVVDRDGSLLISDWADGQRPKRGRGRIYRIRYVGDRNRDSQEKPIDVASLKTSALPEVLNSDSYYQRVAAQLELERRGPDAVEHVKGALANDKLNAHGRMHAAWFLPNAVGEEALDDLFRLAESDIDARVRAQAIRAVGDLTDPVLTTHRLKVGRGSSEIAERIAALGHNDPRVLLEILIVLSRLRWDHSPVWLSEHLQNSDPALDHAAMQLLRNADNWPAVVRLLDAESNAVDFRSLALRAMAGQSVPYLAERLFERLGQEKDSGRRREYIDLLARMARKPGPWEYWGFRPGLRPANSVDWEQTAAIEPALNAALKDTDRNVRAFALQRMRRENVEVEFAALASWLREDTDEFRVVAILEAAGENPAETVRPILAETVRCKDYATGSRLQALSMLVERIDAKKSRALVQLAEQLEHGPVLAAVLSEFGEQAPASADRVLLSKLGSQEALVRAAAIRALGRRGNIDARRHVPVLLADADLEVRRAAAEAAGLLSVRAAADRLLELADEDDALCTACLDSLRRLNDARAVPQAVGSLQDSQTQLAALAYLRELGGPDSLEAVTRTGLLHPDFDVQSAVVSTLAEWQRRTDLDSADAKRLQQALAQVQGQSGLPLCWRVSEPMSSQDAELVINSLTGDMAEVQDNVPAQWKTMLARGTTAEIRLPAGSNSNTSVWLATAEVSVNDETPIEAHISATGGLQVWRDEASVYHRRSPAAFQPNSENFSATLEPGMNRLLVRLTSNDRSPRFHLWFRRRSSKAEHERLMQAALNGRGNAERGREVFVNAERSQCLRCHRMGDEGGKIGPDLSGIGSRFSRIHLIESILEPSRTVAPSYETMVVAMQDGRVFTGVKVSETNDELVLGDSKGKTHTLVKGQIEERVVQPISTMPERLEQRLTEREFIDLLAFLLDQKGNRPAHRSPSRVKAATN